MNYILYCKTANACITDDANHDGFLPQACYVHDELTFEEDSRLAKDVYLQRRERPGL